MMSQTAFCSGATSTACSIAATSPSPRSLRFEVSRRIKEEFENGRDYYGLHGRQVHVPDKLTGRPDSAALTWHNENRYLG